jgi:hypothetical protein
MQRTRNQENLQTPDIENETKNQKQVGRKPTKGSLLDHKNNASDSGTYLNTVLETIQLPACISDLNAGLTDMDRDALSHCRCFLQTPSKALTIEQERKQTDRSLHFTKTFETGTKMQRKYWLTLAESLKAKTEGKIFEESVCKDAFTKCNIERKNEECRNGGFCGLFNPCFLTGGPGRHSQFLRFGDRLKPVSRHRLHLPVWTLSLPVVAPKRESRWAVIGYLLKIPAVLKVAWL